MTQPEPELKPNQIFQRKPENVCLPPSNLTELERGRDDEKKVQCLFIRHILNYTGYTGNQK